MSELHPAAQIELKRLENESLKYKFYANLLTYGMIISITLFLLLTTMGIFYLKYKKENQVPDNIINKYTIKKEALKCTKTRE